MLTYMYHPVGIINMVYTYMYRRVSMAKSKPDDEKLDYQISFTLQRSVAKRFVEQCRADNTTVQQALRFIINVYLESKG